MEEILTPNHLIVGRNIPMTAYNAVLDGSNRDVDKIGTKHRYLYRQRVLKEFRTKWKKDYLADLRTKQRIPKTNEYRTPNVGDVVLINEDCSRMSWKVGRILELHPSTDDLVRVASVKLSNTNNVVKRPVKLLYPLEETLVMPTTPII